MNLRINQIYFWIALLLLSGSCNKKQPAPIPPSYPVQIGTAIQKDAPLFIETLGHVESITAINIRSRIEGELTGVLFKQGQEVKKGDLLFTIDARPFESALNEAKATLEQSLANLALAEEKLKRYRILAQDEYYSQIDYETLQANYASTKGLVEQNQAQVDSALINLNYCWIYAPIDGMTGVLQVDYGNLVTNAGETLTTLNQMTPIYVSFSIPEFQLPRIQRARQKQCLQVQAAYENFSEEVFEGALFMMNNAVDEKTGMITLKALFDNEKRELWPGQFVRVRLILDIVKDAVEIPYTAIQMTQSGPVVFVIKADKTIEQRPVTLGQRQDDQILILKGIQPGEKIAIEGLINLAPGVSVYESGGA